MKLKLKRYLIAAFVCGFGVSIGVAAPNLVPLYQLILSDSIASDELLVTNANIYTVNRNAPSAQSILIKQGVITQIGSNIGVKKHASEAARQVDLGGRFLMPGFQDAHLHVAEAGFNDIMCVFEEIHQSVNDYAQEFRQCAEDPQNEGSPWVLGAGISVAEMLADTTQTPRAFLDNLFPNTPVLALDNLGHGAWANSEALMRAFPDIDLSNPTQPQGGILLTDSSGAATGELFENAQQRLRDAAFTAVDPNQIFSYEGLLKGLKAVAENGITTVSDAGGYWTRNDHLLWQKAERENKMTTRAHNALYVFPDKPLDQQIRDITALHSVGNDQLVNFDQVKIYVDGILSLGTSALKQEYDERVVPALDYPRGFQYFKTEELMQYAAQLEDAGFQLHFHATGDNGVKLALDAIQYAKTQNNSADQRHRITHMYIVDSVDITRFADLNVVADFQLNPGSLDTQGYIPFLEQVIGVNRTGSLLSVKTLLDSGTNVVLSSDYDAGPLSPLGTLQRALTRPDNAAQKVPDIHTAIEMMTINVAHHLHQENKTGSLEVGKLADFIVLDKDITTTPVSQLDQVKVLATVLGGDIVFNGGNLF